MFLRAARHSALVPDVCLGSVTLMVAVDEGTWQP